MTSPSEPWSTEAAVTQAIRTKWEQGVVLRELHTEPSNRQAFPLRVRLAGPTADDVAERFGDASRWAQAMRDDADRTGWTLKTRRLRVGAGMQEIPVAAVIDTPERALRLLGPVFEDAAVMFTRALDAATCVDAAARTVALARPLDIVAAAHDWPLLLEVASWVRANPRPGVYPRQVPVAGVHTKVIERHRPLLTRLLEAVLDPSAVDRSQVTFAARFGFLEPPRRARVRADAAVVGVPVAGVGDVTWGVAALAELDVGRLGVMELLIVENLTSFLTVPVPAGRIVLWGAGYGADELLSALPWRNQVATRYWGDIDTHGFAILSRVRAVAPHTESVLMDAETLHAHRPFWTTEPVPTREPLSALNAAEASLFKSLYDGSLGAAIRLEQEFVRFDLVEASLGRALPAALRPLL